jgi:hypothetical protein
MTATIWFELADCIGHALAKRWLARRPSARARPETAPALGRQTVPEVQKPESESGASRQETDSIPSE